MGNMAYTTYVPSLKMRVHMKDIDFYSKVSAVFSYLCFHVFGLSMS